LTNQAIGAGVSLVCKIAAEFVKGTSCSRAGPTPAIVIGAPIAFSKKST
jgi:hypothetical protein